MSIKDWPAQERPREKLLEQGAQALTDAELLAIFLRTGVAGKSAVDLARQLLGEFGSLRALLEADLTAFSTHLGLGPAKYSQLQAVLEMGRRHLAEGLKRDSALESPQQVRDYLKARLRHEPHEIFGCLFLDTRHRVLAFEALFHGTIDGASVYPRQVVKRALAHNAAAVILTHNHPSGIAEPSQADRLLTTRLKDALTLVDVRVLDHFIVGDGEPLSMADW
ncbi:RadC family protein [Pseudomonas sp. HUK17]|uniref:RadC family protein n=1 Tax=Pseudomonas sp. HUK17 TaxID=1799359 RepID=UPI000791C2B5|nr:DNA repair protein RadC [Pseudomonas sp. HUK17]KXJ31082.1 hypothetical protein AX284_04340 [Pseudomonas sp. HUK17]